MSKIGVYIGRFQPLHLGHVKVLKEALDNFDKVIVLVGSANQRISSKNPFPYDLRKNWIHETLNHDEKLFVLPSNDYKSFEKWASEVRSIVSVFTDKDSEISLIGYEKDDSSFYLNTFPEWKRYTTPYHYNLDATSVRENIYKKEGEEVYTKIPHTVAMYIGFDWPDTEDYKNCKEEWLYYEEEKLKFSNYHFPETLRFTCSDAVVTCAGHVLLIRRKYTPGKGCLALPGGFVNRGETRLQTAIRELYEETNLRVPEKVIKGSIKNQQLFDDPNRSLGIPRETLAVHFDIELDPDGKLPRANGGDDASETLWLPLSQLNSVPMYDDHRDIIEYFTGV